MRGSCWGDEGGRCASMMVSIHGIEALTLGLPGWTASNAGMVRGGGGGREIRWQKAESQRVGRIIVAPTTSDLQICADLIEPICYSFEGVAEGRSLG